MVMLEAWRQEMAEPFGEPPVLELGWAEMKAYGPWREKHWKDGWGQVWKGSCVLS